MTERQLPSDFRRCVPCDKVVYPMRSMALAAVVRQRETHGIYMEEYRCTRSAKGGWHVRNLTKRYEKINGKLGMEVEADELREKIKRLDLLAPKDADKSAKGKVRRGTLEDALRKLPPSGKKPVGRRGTFQRATRDNREDGEARDRGTRGTAVTNELRRRTERARLREELRKEKDA